MSIAIELPGLSETQRQIVELAREFARTKIEPFAAEWDRRAHFARDAVAELGRPGFLGTCAPRADHRSGAARRPYHPPHAETRAPGGGAREPPPIHHARTTAE